MIGQHAEMMPYLKWCEDRQLREITLDDVKGMPSSQGGPVMLNRLDLVITSQKV